LSFGLRMATLLMELTQAFYSIRNALPTVFSS